MSISYSQKADPALIDAINRVADAINSKANTQQADHPHLFSYNISGGTVFWPEPEDTIGVIAHVGGALQEILDTIMRPLDGTTPEIRLRNIGWDIKYILEKLREYYPEEDEDNG